MRDDFDIKIDETKKEDKVSYICDKLTTTYNTNILDSASDIIKDKFLLTSLTHRDGNEGKKALMNLICNHFEKDRPKPRFIGGPKNLTVHHSKEHNKMIYIFGEYHSDIIDCDTRFGDESTKETWDKPNSKKMRVEYFLSEFIRTTDVFLDIFLEFHIVPKKEGKYHNDFSPYQDNLRMNKLLENLEECLQRDSRAENCSLARIHYFDIRAFDKEGIVTGSTNINYFSYKVGSIFAVFSGDILTKILKKFMEDQIIKSFLIDYLSQPDETKFKRIWVQHLYKFYHITKELERLKNYDPKMKDKILHFFEKEITEKVMRKREFWLTNVNIILNHTIWSDEIFKLAFKNILYSTVPIIALYPDLYTILRIFKTFNMSEMKEKAYKEATDQPDKAHNIIIYAGDLHSQVYRKFLKEVLNFDKIEVAGKEEPYEQGGKAIYCIDMEPITQPLFSKYHEINKSKDTATDEIKPLVATQKDRIFGQPIVGKTPIYSRSDNEALSLVKIHNHINNRTPCGVKIRDAFSTAFPTIPQFTRSIISGGNRGVHHDFKIEWTGVSIKTVEFKGSKHKKPIDSTKPPWVNGVQFYNGTGSKFNVGKKYARQFYDTMMDKIITHFGITSAKPTFEEWSNDAFRQGKPKTAFVKELREKGYKSEYLSNIRKEFTKLFTLTPEDLEILKNEVYAISNKVLESKDYWLQIHGLIEDPSDFEVRWTGKQTMGTIVSVKKDQTKSDVDFIFTCEDGSVFNAKLRWGYGQCITNIRLDIK
jgi:hypothetical protein